MDLKVQSRANADCVQTLQLVEIIQLYFDFLVSPAVEQNCHLKENWETRILHHF